MPLKRDLTENANGSHNDLGPRPDGRRPIRALLRCLPRRARGWTTPKDSMQIRLSGTPHMSNVVLKYFFMIMLLLVPVLSSGLLPPLQRLC